MHTAPWYIRGQRGKRTVEETWVPPRSTYDPSFSSPPKRTGTHGTAAGRQPQAMQAPPSASDMPLDVACARLENGTRLEAGQILAGEAPPREQEGEEDGSPAHLQQGEQGQRQEQQHAAGLQRWEEMATHQTLRIISHFLSLQGIHDIGLTCQPLHRLVLLPFSPGTQQTAIEGFVTSFVGAPLLTDWPGHRSLRASSTHPFPHALARGRRRIVQSVLRRGLFPWTISRTPSIGGYRAELLAIELYGLRDRNTLGFRRRPAPPHAHPRSSLRIPQRHHRRRESVPRHARCLYPRPPSQRGATRPSRREGERKVRERMRSLV